MRGQCRPRTLNVGLNTVGDAEKDVLRVHAVMNEDLASSGSVEQSDDQHLHLRERTSARQSHRHCRVLGASALTFQAKQVLVESAEKSAPVAGPHRVIQFDC